MKLHWYYKWLCQDLNPGQLDFQACDLVNSAAQRGLWLNDVIWIKRVRQPLRDPSILDQNWIYCLVCSSLQIWHFYSKTKWLNTCNGLLKPVITARNSLCLILVWYCLKIGTFIVLKMNKNTLVTISWIDSNHKARLTMGAKTKQISSAQFTSVCSSYYLIHIVLSVFRI